MTRTFPIIHHLGRRHVVVRASRSLSILVASLALVCPGLARAQDQVTPAPLAPPSLQPPPAAPATQPPLVAPAQTVASTSAVPEGKSPVTALSLSMLGTAAGVGMMAVGSGTDSGGLGLLGVATIVVGPSLGHFYAGETERGLALTGVRAGGGGVMVAGAFWLLLECFPFLTECEGGAGPAIVMSTGLAVVAGSALYSIYDAPRAARRQNARARRLVLTPAPVVGPDHSSGFGLHLSGRF
jgi:hypothetical protein